MKWFVRCIKNYANFKGCARRKEYWNFLLFVFLFSVVARVLDFALFADKPVGLLLSPISGFLGLFIILPQLAVSVRRLHDIGRSGKWVLWLYALTVLWVLALVLAGVSTVDGEMDGSFSSVPAGFLAVLNGGGLAVLVFAITFFVWCCTPGMAGGNKYGPDPKLVSDLNP